MARKPRKPRSIGQRLARGLIATIVVGFVPLVAGWIWAAVTVDAWLKLPHRTDHVSLDRTAPVMRDAVVAMEDGKFYRHRGFDFEAIGAAFRRTPKPDAWCAALAPSASNSPRTRSSGQSGRGAVRCGKPSSQSN